MNVTKLSDPEKSVMLAQLCGWKLEPLRPGVYRLFDRGGQRIDNISSKGIVGIVDMPDLYKLCNMALAWRVAHLASLSMIADDFSSWWIVDMLPEWHKSPAEAQRAWLDKILELAFEAGMVEDGEQHSN